MTIKAGDKVKLIRANKTLGDTIYKVKSVDGPVCEIQEIRESDDFEYSSQQWHTSMVKVV